MQNKSKKSKKKLVIILIILAIAAAIITYFIIKKKKSDTVSYDDYPVYDSSGVTIDSSSNYFAGVIEPEESKYVDADSDREKSSYPRAILSTQETNCFHTRPRMSHFR